MLLRGHRRVDGAAVAHDVCVRHDELLEWSRDVVEIDVGNEAVDAGIDAGRFLAMHEALRGDEIGEHGEIGKATHVGGVGSIAADALEVIALEIVFLRLAQTGLREARVLPQQRVPECRPESDRKSVV